MQTDHDTTIAGMTGAAATNVAITSPNAEGARGATKGDIPVRALSIEEFGKCYGIHKTRAYELINAGELPAKKCGRRTLIPFDAAETWFASLPNFGDTRK